VPLEPAAGAAGAPFEHTADDVVPAPV